MNQAMRNILYVVFEGIKYYNDLILDGRFQFLEIHTEHENGYIAFSHKGLHLRLVLEAV